MPKHFTSSLGVTVMIIFELEMTELFMHPTKPTVPHSTGWKV
jgi:hypothetical protein